MSSLSTKRHNRKGVELLIQGIVQGVGFRPFVYNLATRLGVSGTVSNTSAGVAIQAAATPEQLESFRRLLQKEAPPLARIFSIIEHPLAADLPEGRFSILASVADNETNACIPPDIALCDDCLTELLDPEDRRFGYPFINCTNCGPRFTIVETIPYDRPKTSMKVFSMCAACSAEYRDPNNRRFHAQPNACPVCGPHLTWHGPRGELLASKNPVADALAAINDGRVVAIRGLGGFHLAVNACADGAVQTLRERKQRKAKPLAIMVADIVSARKVAVISSLEERLLLRPEHPIVLLKKKGSSRLADSLAPAVGEIGIMLPYTPLHHLLFRQDDSPFALVMTSGNAGGAPICSGNAEAVDRLFGIADNYLLHNRKIVTRIDDSVVRVAQKKARVLRRARGYVPSPLLLSCSLPPVLGCGGGLKSTFCLAKENIAYPSQHIGDLFNLESFEFYTESIGHMKRVLQIEPTAVACDLHPDYMSSRYAADLDLPLYPVQHHHAHAVAVMAEHGLSEPVLAIVLDGTGYGPDGTIWGGEFLQTDLIGYKRLGYLQCLSLPGGDAATMEPWRMGCSALFHTFGPQALFEKNLPPAMEKVAPERRKIIVEMIEKGFNSPLTSSCGRLFDAIAALLGIRPFASYEGQAAMELEALAWKAVPAHWKEVLHRQVITQQPQLREENGYPVIATSGFIADISDDLTRKVNVADIALRFHFRLIGSIFNMSRRLSAATGIRKIILSGGCLQNRLLLEGLFHVLTQEDFAVFTGNDIPVNDGGISVGQAIIGGLQHVSRHPHAGNKN